ncbi:MAG: hypothetical protein KDA22_09750 [Phycisphaerales bacterium]|nr:hypothetical protein [Phycisphaerales bacterium]
MLGQTLGAWRGRTRAELGLPDDRPIVATGHQAALWHPGIAVKIMLTDLLADRCGGAAVHLVVDQDANAFETIELPVRGTDGVLRAQPWRWTERREEVPTGRQPARRPQPLADGPFALPQVGIGAEAAHALLTRFADAPSVAEQLGRAALSGLRSCGAIDDVPMTSATAMMDTALARRLLEEIEADPWRCAEAYNRAVASVEGSAPPLLVRDDRVEIPLWRLDAEGRRLRAYDDDLARARDERLTLLPRALLNTALMRLGVCDLFVHGVGGGRYDQATDRWIKAWLGVELAPIAVATADVRLPLPELAESKPSVAAARRALRRSWWDPEPRRDGSACPGPRKQAALAAIAAAPRASSTRRQAFRAMHGMLEAVRAEEQGRLRTLEDDLAMAHRRARSMPVAQRRDWMFLLYEPQVLRDLREACRERLAD